MKSSCHISYHFPYFRRAVIFVCILSMLQCLMPMQGRAAFVMRRHPPREQAQKMPNASPDHKVRVRARKIDEKAWEKSLIAAVAGLMFGIVFAITGGYFLMAVGIVFGIMAIIQGSRGIVTKKKRAGAIIGTILGALIVTGGIAGMFAYVPGCFSFGLAGLFGG